MAESHLGLSSEDHSGEWPLYVKVKVIGGARKGKYLPKIFML